MLLILRNICRRYSHLHIFILSLFSMLFQIIRKNASLIAISFSVSCRCCPVNPLIHLKICLSFFLFPYSHRFCYRLLFLLYYYCPSCYTFSLNYINEENRWIFIIELSSRIAAFYFSGDEMTPEFPMITFFLPIIFEKILLLILSHASFGWSSIFSK